jgi:hypothetical protein
LLIQENAKFPRMVVWAVDYDHGKRDLDFDWHQVARKILAASQDYGKNLVQDQRTDFVLVEASSANFHRRTKEVGLALWSKDFERGCPLLTRWA